jgi:polyisoprenoid-binding protein YceI
MKFSSQGDFHLLALRFRRSIFPLVFLALTSFTTALAQSGAPRSIITIHVGKTGLFSGFGHEHTVIAPMASGSVDAKALTTQITVLARQMKLTDPDFSEKDRAEVQSIMLGPKVLDVEKYPEIRFRSTHVQSTGGQSYRVTGTLTLHGENREISFEATGTPDHYHGKAKLKQTDFGIQPVSGGGGAVKVKDELEMEFDFYPADFATSNSH